MPKPIHNTPGTTHPEANCGAYSGNLAMPAYGDGGASACSNPYCQTSAGCQCYVHRGDNIGRSINYPLVPSYTAPHTGPYQDDLATRVARLEQEIKALKERTYLF